MMKIIKIFKSFLCSLFGHKPVHDENIDLIEFSSCEAHCTRCGKRMFGTNGLSEFGQWVYVELE